VLFAFFCGNSVFFRGLKIRSSPHLSAKLRSLGFPYCCKIRRQCSSVAGLNDNQRKANMKPYFVRMLACGAACVALAAQAQPTTDTSSDTSSSSQWKGRLGATGRMGQQELRGSKLMGSEVKTSAGESLAKIEDVVVNPTSGRIDFAILAYKTSGTSTPSTATSTTSTGEKLIPVPWFSLREQGMTGYTSGTSPTSTASTSSRMEQPTFVFTGDKSRLDNAPSFDRNNWPNFAQSDWRQRIYSHFGASATGGATTPGGTSSGTSSTPDTTSPKTPDSSSEAPK
jgi:sporulation protein YlmC with PRC-barrel domain